MIERRAPETQEQPRAEAAFEAAEPVGVTGLLQRKLMRRADRGRDDNGVAEDAGEQVARAGAGGGQALPPMIQRKFEGSLGVELGGVRVHHGADSAEACAAVGARAYATGNDIHFAAGAYDPSSHAGQELLAHEVAHTVQQSGGAGGRAQFKLEVSAPQDHCELEADQAAASMVLGRAASVTPAGGVARSVMRTVGDDVTTAADQSEERSRQAIRTIPSAHVTNVADVEQAQHFYDLLTGTYHDQLNEAIEQDSEFGGYLVHNQNVANSISLYLSQAGVQTGAMGDFAAQYQHCMLSAGRLEAMQTQYASMQIAQHGPNTSEARYAQDLVQGVGLSGQPISADNLGDGEGGASQRGAQDARDAIISSTRQMGSSESHVRSVQHQIQSAIANMAAGPVARRETPGEHGAAEQLHAVEASVARLRRVVDMGVNSAKTWITGQIGGVVGDLGLSEANTERANHGVEWGADQLAEHVATMLSEAPFETELTQARSALAAASSAAHHSEAAALTANIQALYASLRQALQDYARHAAEMQQAQRRYRTRLNQYAHQLDQSRNHGDEGYGIVARYFGEADVFVSQCDAALVVGEEERAQATVVNGSRAAALRNTYYRPAHAAVGFQQRVAEANGQHADEDSLPWVAYVEGVNIVPPQSRRGQSAMGEGGTNEVIEQSMATLRAQRDRIAQGRDALARTFGMDTTGSAR